MWAMNFEVLPVDGKDSPQTFALCNPNQCGISQVHRQIAILPHQFAHAGAIVGTEIRDTAHQRC